MEVIAGGLGIAVSLLLLLTALLLSSRATTPQSELEAQNKRLAEKVDELSEKALPWSLGDTVKWKQGSAAYTGYRIIAFSPANGAYTVPERFGGMKVDPKGSVGKTTRLPQPIVGKQEGNRFTLRRPNILFLQLDE